MTDVTERAAHTSKLARIYQELVFGTKDPAQTAQGSHPTGLLRHLLRPHTYRRGYKEVAGWWLVFVIVTILAAVYVIAFAFNAMPPPSGESDSYSYYNYVTAATPGIIVQKVLLLVPILILLAFGVRSYRINKHLEVVYLHRWALQNGIIEHLALAGNDDTLRNKQLEVITPFFFKDIETGHITKKDGLGDPMAIATKLLRRK
jgi:hypothetical protein